MIAENTNKLVNKFQIKTKKSFGQNFLCDKNIVKNIVSKSKCENKAVIEIGPGLGALSEELCKNASFVLAYEIDKSLIDILKENLKDFDNFEVRNEDFLKVDVGSVISYLKDKCGDVVVVSNLPYYITTPILFKLFEDGEDISCISVMVQKELGERFSAKPNSSDYGAISVMARYLYDVNIVMNISKNVFYPRPKVDSCILQFDKKDIDYGIDRTKFFSFVKLSFTQRRKTLYNNLKNDYSNILKVFEKLGFKDSVRAQELDLDSFISLFKELEHER